MGWNFQIVYILVSTSNDINRWKLIEIKWVFIKPNTFALLPLNSIFMGLGYKLSNKNIFSPVNTWSPSVMSSLNDCRKELINSRLAFKCTPFRDVWDHRLCAGICAYSYVHNINMHQLRPHDEIFSGFLNYIPTWKNMLCLLKYFLDVTKGVQLSQIYQEGNGLVIARNWKKFKFDSFIPLKIWNLVPYLKVVLY